MKFLHFSTKSSGQYTDGRIWRTDEDVKSAYKSGSNQLSKGSASVFSNV